jgi:hypothetical protein
MGLQTVPGFISQAGYLHPAELMRNFQHAIAAGRSGAIRYPMFEVSGTGVANQIQITSGQAIICGSESDTQGAYFVWSDASELVTVPAADGSYDRIDTLLLRVADPQYGTITGLPRAYWDVVSGVAASSPSVRNNANFNVGGGFYQPGAWLRIADIRRNTGDTTVIGSRIYPTHYYIRRGHVTHGMSSSSVTGYGGPYSAGSQLGDRFICVDTGDELRHNGSSWKKWSTDWIDWSSSMSILSVAGTDPTKGNSTYKARYKYVDGAVIFEFYAQIGSTWSSGSGVYKIPLPVAADSDSGYASIGSGWINDSGVALRIGSFYVQSDYVLGDFYPGGAFSATMMTWNSPDSFRGSVTYGPA